MNRKESKPYIYHGPPTKKEYLKELEAHLDNFNKFQTGKEQTDEKENRNSNNS